SKSLCIKFASQSLPKYVSLFDTRHAVSTFIPKVRICYNCFRAGHISKSCRSNARCMRCGESPHTNLQECSMHNVPPRCINCNGSHLPTSNECLLVIKQKKIIALAAQENISLVAARKRISAEFKTPERDTRFDCTNYPDINRGSEPYSRRTDSINNRYAVLNSELLSKSNDHTYASVASTGTRRPSPPTGINTCASESYYTASRNSTRAAPEPAHFKLRRDPRDDLLLYRNG
ncbi:hypothetical protein ALC57_04339, partial [Trachymyrmex cornetzi]